jgi:hypothetical protein
VVWVGSGQKGNVVSVPKNDDQPLIGPEVLYPTPWRLAETRGGETVIACATGCQAAAVYDDRLGAVIVQVVNAAAESERREQQSARATVAAIEDALTGCELSESVASGGDVVTRVQGLRQDMERLREEVQRLMKEPPW